MIPSVQHFCGSYIIDLWMFVRAYRLGEWCMWPLSTLLWVMYVVFMINLTLNNRTNKFQYYPCPWAKALLSWWCVCILYIVFMCSSVLCGDLLYMWCLHVLCVCVCVCVCVWYSYQCRHLYNNAHIQGCGLLCLQYIKSVSLCVLWSPPYLSHKLQSSLGMRLSPYLS